MSEEIKSLIDFAGTGAEALAVLVASFAPVAPIVKLGLCTIVLAFMTLRFINNWKNRKK